MSGRFISVARSLTEPYSALEAWTYDRLVGGGVARPLFAEVDAAIAPLAEHASLLDVGCGGGQLISALAARHATLRMDGVDLSAGQVRRARARCAHVAARVRFDEASALALPYADDRFDRVVSLASLKHWPDKARGLHEAVRVARPGGRVFIAEVNRGCTLDDARRFLAALDVPRRFFPAMLPFFRTYVLGQGWDADEARALIAPLRLEGAGVVRLSALPFLAIVGTKV